MALLGALVLATAWLTMRLIAISASRGVALESLGVKLTVLLMHVAQLALCWIFLRTGNHEGASFVLTAGLLLLILMYAVVGVLIPRRHFAEYLRFGYRRLLEQGPSQTKE